MRSLLETSNEIMARVFEGEIDAEEMVDYAEQKIFDISEKRITVSFEKMDSLLGDTFKTIEDLYSKKYAITGVPSGFQDLDKFTTGFQNSDLIVMGGRPGMGKTAFCLNIAQSVALKAKIPVAIFSLEMSKEQLSLRMLCAEARLDSSRLRGGFFSMDDWHRLTDAAGILSESPIYIDDTPSISAMEIRAKARRLKMDKNIGLIIIDYLQLMKSRSGAERRDLEISEISRSLKALAKELELPVVALSQLNRMLEQRNDKRPKLSDLRESGDLEQDADLVAFIYRDEVYNQEENNPQKGMAEIILAKQRNGPTGKVTLTFLDAYTRFENLAPEEMVDNV